MTGTACVCSLTVVARALGGLAEAALWCAYLECGGNRPPADLGAYLEGKVPWPDGEHNALSQALNEALWDVGSPSLVPLRDVAGEARR